MKKFIFLLSFPIMLLSCEKNNFSQDQNMKTNCTEDVQALTTENSIVIEDGQYIFTYSLTDQENLFFETKEDVNAIKKQKVSQDLLGIDGSWIESLKQIKTPTGGYAFHIVPVDKSLEEALLEYVVLDNTKDMVKLEFLSGNNTKPYIATICSAEGDISNFNQMFPEAIIVNGEERWVGPLIEFLKIVAVVVSKYCVGQRVVAVENLRENNCIPVSTACGAKCRKCGNKG